MKIAKAYLYITFMLFLLHSCVELGTRSNSTILTVNPTGDKSGLESESFSTIDEALIRASELKADAPDLLVTIRLLAGEYYLNNTLKIDPNLSNLHIQGAGLDLVSIKGSIPLSLSWAKSDSQVYVAEVPSDLEFDQLVINGKPQVMARYPNYDETSHYWQGFAADALSKERLANWSNSQGAFFHALHRGRWGGFHWEIAGVNEDSTAILKGGHQNNRGSKPHEEYRMVENVLDELDSPGEWYLDPDKNKLYFWPTAELDLTNAKIEVSNLKGLLELRGTVEDPVKNVQISGITFEHSQRTFMEEYEPLLRSDWTIYRGAALFFEGTENCTIVNSEFKDLGGNAIMASKYNRGLSIKENHIHDIGASAVSFIGDPSAVRSPSFNYSQYVKLSEIDTVKGPKNELFPKECLVENNLIHRIGRIEKQTSGVQIAMAMDITVRHNSIYDVPRAGINIGDGTWGGHLLEYNDVFNTVLETSDHGSFNSWGRDRFWHPNRKLMDSITTAHPDLYKLDAIHTTVIRNNRFRCDHGWDIDLDDGSSNYHIYNNLCLARGIKLREGFQRVVENNILVNNSLHPHVWFANSRDVFKHNIVEDAYQDVGLLGWGKELDSNFFPTEVAMLKSRVYDRDLNSTFGDPMFKAPDALDFSVDENSPALEVGFENFPMDQFGVQKPALKAIAKTPEVPVKDASLTENSSPVVAWLRNQLKTVDSEQEQSAYGLSSAEGIIVLRIWKPSPAVRGNGIRQGDVILEVEGTKVVNTIGFLTETRKYQDEGTMEVVVMRNQQPKSLAIALK